MTSRRYLNYRKLLTLLYASCAGTDAPEGIGRLRTHAQDLLLTRSTATAIEAVDLRRSAAAELSVLVADGAMPRGVAADAYGHICSCGPGEDIATVAGAEPFDELELAELGRERL